MLYYVFDNVKLAATASLQIAHAVHLRSEAGFRRSRFDPRKHYSDLLVHPDTGQAAIPADAGGIPTERYRRAGLIKLPEPQELTFDWYEGDTPEIEADRKRRSPHTQKGRPDEPPQPPKRRP